MKKKLLFTIILFISAAAAHAQPSTLPTFTLPDPQGGMHSSAQLVANGLVIIVSAPLLHDKSAQEGWSKDLAVTKGTNPASLVLLEDLAASSFEGIAKKDLRKDWKPGTLPIPLEDNTGKVHGAFGVEKDQTKVFVYDKSGHLIYSQSGSPSEEAAKAVWAKLSK